MTLSGIRVTIEFRRETKCQRLRHGRRTRTEKLDLRLTKSAKHILHSAAQAERRSVSDFVLESALARAAETLPDRQRFGLNAKQWKAFQRRSMLRPDPPLGWRSC